MPPPCMNRILKWAGMASSSRRSASAGFVDADELFAAVAHLHHAHAAAMPIEHFGSGLLQDFFRDGGRAGGEIERGGSSFLQIKSS